MNLVVVPMPESATVIGSTGKKSWIPLPGGEIEFIASTEDGVGPFAACSLFSPMGDFHDQGTAIETAESIMSALFEPGEGGDGAHVANCSSSPERLPGKGVSRRDLLLGLRLMRD